MKKNRSKLIGLLIACMTLVLVACGQSSTSNDTSEGQSSGSTEKININFMAAQQSGAWYPLAVGITEMMTKEIDYLGNVSIQPGGGISNVIALQEGVGQIGFSQAAPTVDGYLANPPFDKKTDKVQYMMSLFPHQTHIIVLKGSGIETIDDIKGTRINVGQQGLLGEDIAARILDIHGMSYNDMASVANLSFADSVEQMRDGRLDVLFWTVPAPFAVINDLSQSRDIDLIPLPDSTIEALVGQNSGMFETTLEANTYNGVDYDVKTIQSPIVVLASEDTSEDLVYQTTKLIYEGLDHLAQINPSIGKLDPETDLPVDIGIPRHPGAEKFFKEIGLLQ